MYDNVNCKSPHAPERIGGRVYDNVNCKSPHAPEGIGGRMCANVDCKSPHAPEGSIRKTLKARVIGEQLTQARKWELNKGQKVKAHKFHVNPQPKKIKDMQDKLENELKRPYAVEMPHGGPLRDERNKVIKGKKLVLKDCDKHLKMHGN